MKLSVAKEVEVLLFRPNIGARTQYVHFDNLGFITLIDIQTVRYYGVIFLNQYILSRHDSALASKLLKIYFSLFKLSMNHGELESRMLDALLTGLCY